ncbi:MAG TPA: CAP domain-containing protein [Rubricoccaceae bacterium]|jgi:uncharacterized protein YkwD
MRSLLSLVLAVGLASCVPSPPRPTSAVRSDERPDVSAADLERGVHAATNAARRRERLGVLGTDGALAAVARRHSADMARLGFFNHIAPDGSDANARAASSGLACRVTEGNQMFTGFSENLAQVWLYSRWTETRTAIGTRRMYDWLSRDEVVAETVDGWLASPGHRRNLLLRHATREGVGVVIGADGQVFVTQLLC